MESYNVWLVISFVAYTLGIISIGLYSSRLRMMTGLIVTVVWRETPVLKAATDEWTPDFVPAFPAGRLVGRATVRRPSAEGH